MMNARRYFFCIVLTVLAGGLTALADEGMWNLQDIDRLPYDKLKSLGLQLTFEQIYNPAGGGISDAAVNVAGSSGSFVSPDGLVITNHHVAFTAIQRQSTTEHNYLEDGFVANNRAEEIQAIGFNLYVILSREDVTSQVLGAIDPGWDGIKRHREIEKIIKRIIARSEKGKDVECRISSFFGGKQYIMTTYFKIRDVRLVYAPPRSIGDYGGETDNWMWPRHAGDFTLLRGYVAPDGKSADYDTRNVPYRPKRFFPVSKAGVEADDFVMVIGFPGTTSRYDISLAIDEMVNYSYPRDIKLRQDLIAIMEAAAARDSAVAIRLSSPLKGLYNYLKKNQGMLDGFKRSSLLQSKVEEELALMQFIKSDKKLLDKYGRIFQQFDSLYSEKKKYRDKDFILGWMVYRTDLLKFASYINKWSLEKSKKDIDREAGYQNRDTLDYIEALTYGQINLVPAVDKEIFKYFLRRARELPEGQKIAAVENQFTGVGADQITAKIDEFADRLYAGTKLVNTEDRLRLFRMSRAELLKQGDPFIDFAFQLEADREEIRNKEKAFDGTMTKLEPLLISAYAEWKKENFYPDANSTLRFNYGTVRGYSPRDAVHYHHLTTLSGVIEKNSGVDPFDAPSQLVEVFKKKDYGDYIDPSLGDIPVNFLSDNDITNGNSGSPVLNGKGELVGLAFDGNYEAMTSDYKFDPAITRTISVDIRYVLFIMEKVFPAPNLIKEMQIN